MNRRNFLSLAALAIAGKAAERVFPFRVYSIPKEIVVADARYLGIDWGFDSPTALYGIPYYLLDGHSDSVGPFMGLSRESYPKAILPPVDWYSTAPQFSRP